MKISILIPAVLSLISFTACSQNAAQQQNKAGGTKQLVGGSCEGCEAIYEQAPSFDTLSAVATLPDFNEPGTRIAISGIVYQRDQRTPAKDVVIYIYHTDQSGKYVAKAGQTGWAKRHGYIRGWVKTDQHGFYQFYTLRPARYPGSNAVEHIHVTVKEPGKNEYWVSEYLFEDDSLLSAAERKKYEFRGGNGIIKLVPQANGISHVTRHIILGLNVPDYPYAGLPKIKSGLAVGSICPAFDPLHLSGADSGKTVCPMCKYGYGLGVMVWFNHANLDQMGEFAKTLEKEMEKQGVKKLRVFLVYMNPLYKQDSNTGEDERKIRQWCDELGLKRVAMVWVPSPVDEETCGLYKINPEAKNTVFVYKKRTIIGKWVNVEYNDETVNAILKKAVSATL